MNIEENITQKIDLQNNIGLCRYKNFVAQQNHNAFSVFYDLLKQYKPKNILEIGTGLGGFTQFLDLCIQELRLDTKLISFEIRGQIWHEEMISSGIDVRIQNIFSEDYSDVESFIVDFIKQDGLTLVLCDGGDKIREFSILSKFLKQNDIIMAHDYAPNDSYFKENMIGKIWNWMEIQDSDIDNACLEQALVPFNSDNFLSVAWLARTKK